MKDYAKAKDVAASLSRLCGEPVAVVSLFGRFWPSSLALRGPRGHGLRRYICEVVYPPSREV